MAKHSQTVKSRLDGVKKLLTAITTETRLLDTPLGAWVNLLQQHYKTVYNSQTLTLNIDTACYKLTQKQRRQCFFTAILTTQPTHPAPLDSESCTTKPGTAFSIFLEPTTNQNTNWHNSWLQQATIHAVPTHNWLLLCTDGGYNADKQIASYA